MGFFCWTQTDIDPSVADSSIAAARDFRPVEPLSLNPSRSFNALFCLVASSVAFLIPVSGLAQTDQSQIEQGAYVARAAGCMSCHGEDLAGGYQVETPMGTIVASNISPSKDYGIGGYSRDDLARVLREGVSPDRRLYPAMPYASYIGMTDSDIDALHVWLQDQPPVESSPEQQTDLPFPFNIRTGVMAWNWLYLDDPNLTPVDDPLLARGAYLVDHLGHCGECHTPRTDLFGVRNELYLAGAVIDGWLAPNLTSDLETGIGAWAAQDIVDYLGTGTAGNIVQAAGPMGKLVKHATSHLDEGDLFAIAAYLKTIPAIDSRDQDIPALVPLAEREIPTHRFNQIREEMTQVAARDDLSEVEHLFVDHCAACHGVSGQGQPQAYYPPLVQNVALRREDPRNLLLVLTQGVPAGKLYRAPAMPGFADELSNDQIAMLANYTRITFGGRQDSSLTSADVEQALTQDTAMPPALRGLQVAAWVGLFVLLLAGGLVAWWFVRRRGHPAHRKVKP